MNRRKKTPQPLTPEEWAIWRALWRIPEFRRHYGLDRTPPRLAEIAAFLGITHQAVSLIERRAIRKLKLALLRKHHHER